MCIGLGFVMLLESINQWHNHRIDMMHHTVLIPSISFIYPYVHSFLIVPSLIKPREPFQHQDSSIGRPKLKNSEDQLEDQENL